MRAIIYPQTKSIDGTINNHLLVDQVVQTVHRKRIYIKHSNHDHQPFGPITDTTVTAYGFVVEYLSKFLNSN